jgi:N-acetylmuramoyl-L-alanine amidase
MATPPDIVICVGHSRSGDDGAVSRGKVSEWTYNSGLAPMITWRLEAAGWKTLIIDKYEGGGYGTAMTWLTGELKEHKAKAALELHFNSSSNANSTGHEWFHNNTGDKLATALKQSFQASISELKARGITNRHSSGNGSRFLGGAPCPAVIGEPFFGSNEADWKIGEDKERIAGAYANGIITWLAASKVAAIVGAAVGAAVGAVGGLAR